MRRKKETNMKKFFNLDYLNTFVIAAETGKLNVTAEMTYLSHSAVSMQIKKLETQIGTPLFIRNKSSLTLTKGGEILLANATKLLEQNDKLFGFFEESTWDGTIAIGVPTDYATLFMTKLYPEIKRQLPEYQITVDYGRSRAIRKKINERKLDFGIVAMEPQFEDDVFLWEEDLQWICSKDFERPLNYFPVALFSDDCVVNNHSFYCLKKSNIPFKIMFTSPILTNIVDCVDIGQAISLLPDSSLTENMTTIPKEFIDCPYDLKMGCTWNDNTDKKAINTILTCLQDYFYEFEADKDSI